jgi:hypothetical protein
LPSAELKGKTENFAKALLASDHKILTFDTEFNKNLLKAGSELLER